MTSRNFGKKIAFGFAIGSFGSTVISLLFLVYFLATRGGSDVMSASLLATTLFFLSCGVVLFLMSTPPKHKLEPWDSAEKVK